MDEKIGVGETVLVIKVPGAIPNEILEALYNEQEAKHFIFFTEILKKLEPEKISDYGQQWIWHILNM